MINRKNVKQVLKKIEEIEKRHPLREYCKIFLPDYHNIGKNY